MNYYDFSKVEFINDKTKLIESVMQLSPNNEPNLMVKRRIENPILVLDIQINGGRFTLKDWKAEKFVKDFNDYLALKEVALK